jgi:predicted amidohydrolase
MTSTLRIATVLPEAYRGAEEKKNMDVARDYIIQAAQAGARIVCFPEGFPGPYFDNSTWSSLEVIAEAAQKNNIHVMYGTVEPTQDGYDAYYVVQKIVAPDGKLIDTYRRMQPTPEAVNRVLTGEKTIAPGDRLVHFDVDGVKVGILICSEIFCPELVRMHALEGVEVLFAPTGALLYELRDTWRNVIWTRAIENLFYIATCQQLFGMEDGLGIIASPEKIMVERKQPGLVVADCDIDRIRWLRSQDESLALPKPYRVVPGLLRYRRPELYGRLTDTSIEHSDFHYYKRSS